MVGDDGDHFPNLSKIDSSGCGAFTGMYVINNQIPTWTTSEQQSLHHSAVALIGNADILRPQGGINGERDLVAAARTPQTFGVIVGIPGTQPYSTYRMDYLFVTTDLKYHVGHVCWVSTPLPRSGLPQIKLQYDAWNGGTKTVSLTPNTGTFATQNDPDKPGQLVAAGAVGFNDASNLSQDIFDSDCKDVVNVTAVAAR
jgi:hypothetical protein